MSAGSVSVRSWSCSRCTFQHHAPGNRCVMCGELRVSSAQMRAFVLGETIRASSKNNHLTSSTTPSKVAMPDGNHNDAGNIAATMTEPPVVRVVPGPGRVLNVCVANPYAKKSSSVTQHSSTMSAPSVVDNPSHTANRQCRVGSSESAQATAVERSFLPEEPPSVAQSVRPVELILSEPRTNSDGGSSVSAQGTAPGPPSIVASLRRVAHTFVSALSTYQPGPVPLAEDDSINEWVYPVNPDYPKRQYQLEIAETAVFHNTLVSLPTGLGKTLIASVVLYNYYRWFPTGKVIFLAPTLPLVTQQVSACAHIMRIPERDTAVLTGKQHADDRVRVWEERRCFFCTPQTVHNDLEANRVDAKTVVCLVLDEAHKATGGYAYVRIVEHLRRAGAKFRILGLSATPGTNIKAIQQVIDVLCINRIEAHTESDSSVAPYIHERTSEIIIVKQVSAAKSIEHALNGVIDPLLSRLRSAGAAITGNASLTAWNVMRARDEYRKKTEDERMTGHFYAAQQLVQIRSDLNRLGVGLVRTKLLRLKTERQSGIMASIVKGKEFNDLWNEVCKATCDPNSSDVTTQDRLMNNPKLSKLREILNEHFERARACSRSSRAIVFSQLRDSVSEIVRVLEPLNPLVRPRHFVGQGKGSSAKGDSGGGISSLKGMKQSEQQEVIHQFKMNLFNVLVCTCIGEEGLDIGEVDLIVNFDTLRSPIRTIQRTGRTGRKRDGRVVCLVAEGAEERTLTASRQSERTLFHALKNPKSFKVMPAIPMLPENPPLTEKNMDQSMSFRMSQVEGHNAARKRPRESNRMKLIKTWRLTSDKESHRRQILGDLGDCVIECSGFFPSAVRRRLLMGRNHRSSLTSNSRMRYSGNATATILEHLSDHYPPPSRCSIMKSSRSLRRCASSIEEIFPLFDVEKLSIATVLRDGAAIVESCVATVNDFVVLDPVPRAPMAHVGISDCRNMETGQSTTEQTTANTSQTDGQQRCGGSQDVLNTEQVETADAANSVEDHDADDIVDEFILPTPSDSPSSARSRDPTILADTPRSITLKQQEMLADEPIDTPTDLTGPGTDMTTIQPNLGIASLPGVFEDEFSLPSQDSSSDEESVRANIGSAPPTEGGRQDPLRQAVQDPDTHMGTQESEDSVPIVVKTRMISKRMAICDTPDTMSLQHPSHNRAHGEQGDLESRVLKAAINRGSDFPDHSNCSKNLLEGRFTELTAPPSDVPVLFDGLTNTQENAGNDNACDIVCWVCSGPDSPDNDPIILCDGPGSGEICELAVHTSCYSISVDLDPSKEWVCDPCSFYRNGGLGKCVCALCGQGGGALKSNHPVGWRHVDCHRSQMKPASSSRAKTAKIKNVRYFIDEEAGIDSHEDIDGDEDEDDIEAIEHEEALQSSFINDSSQLDYIEVDHAEVTRDNEQDGMHRALDRERDRQKLLATPILNRRMQGAKQRHSLTDSSQSAPDSAHGLGSMHFIRSVIEHHRNGGASEDIEDFYNRMQAESSPHPLDDSTLVPIREPPQPVAMAYESDSE